MFMFFVFAYFLQPYFSLLRNQSFCAHYRWFPCAYYTSQLYISLLLSYFSIIIPVEHPQIMFMQFIIFFYQLFIKYVLFLFFLLFRMCIYLYYTYIAPRPYPYNTHFSRYCSKSHNFPLKLLCTKKPISNFPFSPLLLKKIYFSYFHFFLYCFS